MASFVYAEVMKRVPECDPELLRTALRQSDFPSCEYALANLRMWSDSFQTRAGMFRGQLYFHMSDIDELLFPCGSGLPTADDLHYVSEGMKAAGYSGTIAHVPPCGIEIPGLAEFYHIQPMDDGNDEYIYKTETLAELRGSKLSKKRNLISQFERLYSPYEIREITPSDHDTIRSLNDQWCRERDGMRSIENEQKALANALNCFDKLGLHGLILTAGGNIEAFAIFSPINSDSWTVHFEKARSDCKGAAQVINQQTAKYLTGKCEYINREQDLGIPGLRQAKQSYMPDRMLKDHLLILK